MPIETEQDVVREIIHLEEHALRRWCAGDPSGFLEISAEDVVYFDPFQAHRLDGLAALRALYEPLRGQIAAERFELIDPKVHLAGAAAVLTFNFVAYDAAGVASRWNCTEVFRRTDDEWRIIQTHWSLTQPRLADAAPGGA